MEHNFQFGYSGWEFRTASQDIPFILEIVRSGKQIYPYHLQSNRNFRIFLVNGKYSMSFSSFS